MVKKFSPPVIYFIVALARTLTLATGSKQAEQFPKTICHMTVKVWASLKEIGSPLATKEDTS
jgi:hypothetical protein